MQRGFPKPPPKPQPPTTPYPFPEIKTTYWEDDRLLSTSFFSQRIPADHGTRFVFFVCWLLLVLFFVVWKFVCVLRIQSCCQTRA